MTFLTVVSVLMLCGAAADSDPSIPSIPRSQKLHVITSYFEVVESKVRRQYLQDFAEYLAQFPEIELWVVEVAFEDRGFHVTQADNPRHLQIRSKQILWVKENVINIMIKKLPPEVQYIAVIDADVEFCDKQWAVRTL